MTADAFPSFTGVSHPTFRQQWLLEGLDRIFSADARFQRVGFHLWAEHHDNDDENVELKGDAIFTCRDLPDGRRDRIAEEEMDEISAVRMFERRAAELWYCVPTKPSEDGTLNGHLSFYAERGLIRCAYDACIGKEPRFLLVARHDGEGWVSEESLTIPMEDVALVDVASNEHRDALQQAFDPGWYGFDGLPATTGVTVDEDDMMVFSIEPGHLVANVTQ